MAFGLMFMAVEGSQVPKCGENCSRLESGRCDCEINCCRSDTQGDEGHRLQAFICGEPWRRPCPCYLDLEMLFRTGEVGWGQFVDLNPDYAAVVSRDRRDSWLRSVRSFPLLPLSVQSQGFDTRGGPWLTWVTRPRLATCSAPLTVRP